MFTTGTIVKIAMRISTIVLLLSLMGCKSSDSQTLSVDEMVLQEEASVYIVRINDTIEVIQDFYVDNQVPKTIFSANIIFDFLDNNEGDINISRAGGYDKNNDFIGGQCKVFCVKS